MQHMMQQTYINVKPIIAINGKGFYKSSTSKNPEYGKRWAIEKYSQDLKRYLDCRRTDLLASIRLQCNIFMPNCIPDKVLVNSVWW